MVGGDARAHGTGACMLSGARGSRQALRSTRTCELHKTLSDRVPLRPSFHGSNTRNSCIGGMRHLHAGREGRTGEMYAGVPTRLFGGVSSWSCLQKPKSEIFSTGVGERSGADCSILINVFLHACHHSAGLTWHCMSSPPCRACRLLAPAHTPVPAQQALQLRPPNAGCLRAPPLFSIATFTATRQLHCANADSNSHVQCCKHPSIQEARQPKNKVRTRA